MKVLWWVVALLSWGAVAGAQGVPTRETSGSGAASETPSRDEDDAEVPGRRFEPRVPGGRPRDGEHPEGTPVCNDCIRGSGSTATVTGAALAALELNVTLSSSARSTTTISSITALIKNGTTTQSLGSLSPSWSQTKTYASTGLGSFGKRANWTTSARVQVTVSYKVGSTTKPNLVFELTPSFK